MKKNFILITLTAVVFTSACSKPSASDAVFSLIPLDKKSSWPALRDEQLSGKVFGNDWSASSAAVRPVVNNTDELFLDIYAEPVSDACAPQANLKKPMATVIIPSNYKAAEYAYDTLGLGGDQTGNPMTFIGYAATTKNVVAEKTKLQIDTISNAGFEAKIYASAIEQDGTASEINGKISVVDCRKKVDFKVWQDLAAWYGLLSFDGKTANNETSIIEMNRDSKFYDRATQKYLNVLSFPLYGSVSANSSMQYDFGPIDGLGSTEISGNIMKYAYSGPLTYNGMDITITLNLTVEKKASQLDVQYVLEVPGHIAKTSHQFILVK